MNFLQLFSAYTPDDDLREILSQVVVSRADIDVPGRSICAELYSEVYITLKTLEDLQARLCELYRMKEIRLPIRFPEEAFEKMDWSELTEWISRSYPMATGILADCSWELIDENLLLLKLTNKNCGGLAKYLHLAEEFIRERFGCTIRIELQVERPLEGEALFEETERIRLAAMQHVPQVHLAAPKPAAEKPKVNTVLYGRPIRNKPIPMREVSLDSARVCVEGEVILVNHKFLTDFYVFFFEHFNNRHRLISGVILNGISRL